MTMPGWVDSLARKQRGVTGAGVRVTPHAARASPRAHARRPQEVEFWLAAKTSAHCHKAVVNELRGLPAHPCRGCTQGSLPCGADWSGSQHKRGRRESEGAVARHIRRAVPRLHPRQPAVRGGLERVTTQEG